MDKTQFVFRLVLSESCSRMNCHSWIGPVGMGDMGAGEENTEEERGVGRGARVDRRAAAEIE